MKKTIALLLTALLCAVCLSACAKPENQILGKWTGEASILGVVTEYSYEFREDGSGVMSTALNLGLEMHYTITDTELSVTTALLGIENTDTYTYVFSGDTLTLTEVGTENTVTLTRAK